MKDFIIGTLIFIDEGREFDGNNPVKFPGQLIGGDKAAGTAVAVIKRMDVAEDVMEDSNSYETGNLFVIEYMKGAVHGGYDF